MPILTERLSGGIVTTRDPSELAPGELQTGDECVYRLHDHSVYGRPGRTSYNTTTIKDSTGATCPVKGLAHLSFSGSRTDQILALGGNDNGTGTLWAGDFSTINGTATFTKMTGPGQVTDATINNSTTVTSASNGFTNMVEGASIQGTGIPYGAVVITVSSPSSIIISKTTTGGLQVIAATFNAGIALTPEDSGYEIMDVVQWGGAYYAVFAHGEMQRIYYTSRGSLTSGGTSVVLSDLLVGRPVGLLAVTVQPTVTTISGSWSSVLGNGFYWFLVTEAYNPGQPDEVEGTYLPVDDKGKKLGPIAVSITDYTTQGVRVVRPTRVNDGSSLLAKGRIATHWHIYMSPRQADSVVTPSLATFTRVATIPMFDETGAAKTTADLKDALTSRAGYPTAVANVAGRNSFFNSAGFIGAPDNNGAVAKSGTSTDGVGGQDGMNKLQSFGFSGSDATFSGLTVTGLRIGIRGVADPSGNAGRAAGFLLWLRTATKNAPSIFGVFTTKNPTVLFFGDQFDNQGITWAAGDFAVGGGFEIWVEKNGTGSRQRLVVDSLEVTVFYTGTSINNNGRPFRVVTYRDSIGFTIDEPARLPAPESSTFDIFQGSIVANDLGSPVDPKTGKAHSEGSALRWSLPGEPEAWPRPYVLSFNGRKNDTVTCIRRLNQILVVGLKETVRRVNYLPSETDTDFREGPAHEPISEDHGIVGPLAAVRFTQPRGGTHLAYVSYNAIYYTDGVTDDYLNRDIKIGTFIDPAFISQCVFRNYAKEQWLVLYYTPLGGTRNTKALIFCYDKPKEDGTFRAIGPITVSARSSCEATLNGVPLLLTGHQFGGKIWTEDQGSDLTGYTIDGSTQITAAPSITTRRFYPAGLDRNARVERQYIQHDAAGTATPFTNVGMTAGVTTITRGAGFFGLAKGHRVVSTNIPGDAIILSVSGTTAVISQAPFETQTGTVTFDTGTISVTLRGQSIGQAITSLATTYSSTLVGGLLSTALDGHAQAFDLKIEKVFVDVLTDLNTALRIHHISYDISDAGKEQTRAGAL